MPNLKKVIYGLPIMSAYRTFRTRQLAGNHRQHPDGFQFAGMNALFDPAWEEFERAAIRKELAEATVFIDVGANQGYYSCLAEYMGLKVASIEPEQGNLRFLYSNLKKNSFEAEVFPVAMDCSPGVKEFYGDGDMASMVEGWGGTRKGFMQLVAVNSIDNLFSSRWVGESILIKVDVEGFEGNVISGAKELLSRDVKPNWLIESFVVNHDTDRTPNSDFKSLFDTMFAHGYRCYQVDTGQQVFPAQVIEWVGNPSSAKLGSSNFLFVN